MPQFRTGDLWKEAHDLVCITTNNVISADGGLVMGAGIARTAATRYPGIRQAAAQAIRHRTSGRAYGFIPLPPPFEGLALFQTKRHFRDRSDTGLIEMSVDGLQRYAEQHPEQRIALPFPGIGLGGLAPAAVQPLLAGLPDSITVWTLPQR